MLSQTAVRRTAARHDYEHMSLRHLPFRSLDRFDWTLRREMSAPGQLGAPTLFDRLSDAGLPWAYLDASKLGSRKLLEAVDALDPNVQFVFAYLHQVDMASHLFGIESRLFERTLRRTDELTRSVVERAQRRLPGLEVAVFSDHGMSPVDHIASYPSLWRHPGFPERFCFALDATMVRLWYEDDSPALRDELRTTVARGAPGRFLERDELVQLHLDFDNRLYGDEIYLLEPRTAIFPNFHSMLKPKAMHAYHPDDLEQHGIAIGFRSRPAQRNWSTSHRMRRVGSASSPRPSRSRDDQRRPGDHPGASPGAIAYPDTQASAARRVARLHLDARVACIELRVQRGDRAASRTGGLQRTGRDGRVALRRHPAARFHPDHLEQHGDGTQRRRHLDGIRPLLAFHRRRLIVAGLVVAATIGLTSSAAARFLRIDSGLPIAIVGVGLSLSLLTHSQRGVLQGTKRFGRYSLSTFVEASVKVIGAAVFVIWIWPSVEGAVIAIPLAAACSLVTNSLLLRFLPPGKIDGAARPIEGRRSGATLATFILLALLLAADVLAAKRYLSADAAGLYASISLAGKAVYFATSALAAVSLSGVQRAARTLGGRTSVICGGGRSDRPSARPRWQRCTSPSPSLSSARSSARTTQRRHRISVGLQSLSARTPLRTWPPRTCLPETAVVASRSSVAPRSRS